MHVLIKGYIVLGVGSLITYEKRSIGQEGRHEVAFRVCIGKYYNILGLYQDDGK